MAASGTVAKSSSSQICALTTWHILSSVEQETEWSETKTPHTEQSENIMFQPNKDVCHSITNSPAQRTSPRQMSRQQSKVRVPEGKPVKNGWCKRFLSETVPLQPSLNPSDSTNFLLWHASLDFFLLIFTSACLWMIYLFKKKAHFSFIKKEVRLHLADTNNDVIKSSLRKDLSTSRPSSFLSCVTKILGKYIINFMVSTTSPSPFSLITTFFESI